MALRPVRLRRIVAASALSVVAAACIGSGATPDGSDERAARGADWNGSAVSSVDPDAGIMNLDHLIFIVQENRSFDHYFGTYPGPTASRWTPRAGRPSARGTRWWSDAFPRTAR